MSVRPWGSTKKKDQNLGGGTGWHLVLSVKQRKHSSILWSPTQIRENINNTEDIRMYYLIYQITNILNNKIYIGKHQTSDINDGYMGSGKHLKHAINKHGIDKFKKEILFIFETEQEMNDKEKELVTEEFCKRKDTYNICEGGKGGFGYINSTMTKNEYKKRSLAGNKKKSELLKTDKNFKERTSNNIKSGQKRKNYSPVIWTDAFKSLYPEGVWKGKCHTRQTLEKMSESHKKLDIRGKKNPAYGKIWITDGINNKMINKEDLDYWVSLGYNKGRS